MDLIEDERAVELSTVMAIFPELNYDESFSASLEIPVSPLKPIPVIFLPLSGGVPSGPYLPPSSEDIGATKGGIFSVPQIEMRHIAHFPPLLLRLTLPEGYPSQVPPRINLESKPAWIPEPKLQELKDAAETSWEDMGRDQTVYSYIDYLQQSTENCFDLVPADAAALALRSDLEVALLDFDFKAKRTKFEQETFECGVCLEPKKGSICHRLILCGHVFCVPCLQDFYKNCITEGDVASVKCLAPDCGKDGRTKVPRKRRRKIDRTLDPSELLQIRLEQDVVQRYVKLKRKKMLESNKNTIYCPRQWCQGPARTKEATRTDNEPESDEDSEEAEEPTDYDPNDGQDKFPPPSERLAVCEDCSFAFCSVCKTGWHGEFASCFPRRQYELTAEEEASEKYLKKYSTPCPTCDARCQKTMGCNHMICFQCNTHFCYLCSSWLNESNPYQHFNTVGTPCYQLLWELEGGDGEGVQPVARFEPVAAPVNVVFEPDAAQEAVHAPPPPAPVPPQRVQQGLARAPPMPNYGNPQNGLQRFLQMAANDEEDEWDSDEMDGWESDEID